MCLCLATTEGKRKSSINARVHPIYLQSAGGCQPTLTYTHASTTRRLYLVRSPGRNLQSSESFTRPNCSALKLSRSIALRNFGVVNAYDLGKCTGSWVRQLES